MPSVRVHEVENTPHLLTSAQHNHVKQFAELDRLLHPKGVGYLFCSPVHAVLVLLDVKDQLMALLQTGNSLQ